MIAEFKEVSVLGGMNIFSGIPVTTPGI